VKVVWSPLAEQRAREAVDYIAEDRPLAAAAWLQALIDQVGQLDRYARRGRVVPEIGRAEYRQILRPPYRVVYRVDRTQIVVLTLRHWRRAWDPDEIPVAV